MLRRVSIFLLSLLLTIFSGVVFSSVMAQKNEMTRGITDPLTAEMLPYRTARLGVNAELTLYDTSQLKTQLGLMQQAGIHWVRQFVYWDAIEAEKGTYDWSVYDPIVTAIAESPLEMVAVLMNTPAWARDSQSPADPTTPPANPADFAAFAAAFAARYGDSVHYIQIWDEPNLYTNWGRLSPRAARYTALLGDAYNAIHSQVTGVQVIAAALAPTIEQGPDNVSELTFLKDMYAFGAGAVMDAVAGKPYGFDFAPDDRRVHDRLLNFSRFALLREVMVAHSDTAKPLWGSQWGWNSLPDDWRGLPSIWGSVTETEQISYTLGAIDRAEKEWPWAGGMVLHHWNPPYPADYPQQGFALTTPDGSPTTLLGALIAQSASQHAGVGWHPVRNPDATYSGVWTFSENGADIGWLQDSRLQFTFTGTDIGLILRQDDYVAHLYITVDGEPANALPRDAAGNAYVVLSSGQRQPQFGPVALARDLPYDTHTVEVIADKGFDRYALAGFAVGAGNLAAQYDAWLFGAGAAFVLSFAGLMASAAALPLHAWHTRFRKIFAALGLPLQLAISAATSLALMLTFLMSFGGHEPPFLRREPVLPLIAFLSAGTVYLNIALPLTALAAVILLWCITQRLSIGLALTLFYAPFFLFPVELYSFRFPMVEVIALLTFGAWLLNTFSAWGKARRIGDTFFRLRVHWIDVLAGAYLLLGALSILWASYRGVAITELRTMFIEPILFYLVLRTTPLTDSERRLIVVSLLAAGALVSGISLLQYVRGEAIITAEDSSRRLAGIYGSPNNLALFLGRCLPFALAAILLATQNRTRVLVGIGGCIMLVAFVLTQSVGGLFIGLPAAVVAVLLGAYGRRAIPFLLIIALMTVGAFAVAASQSDRFARALDFTQGTNFYRVRVMQSAIQIIADRPVTGLGLDQFLYAFQDTYIYPDAWPEPELSHPHNFFLDFWIRLGIGGALLSIALVVSASRLSISAVKNTRNQPFWAWVAIGLAGAFADTLAHGLLDNSIFVIDLVYIFWAMLAIGIWMSASSDESPSTPPHIA